MSDNFLYIISTDPFFRPSEENLTIAEEILRGALTSAESIKSSIEDHLVFFSCGSHFERVSCPQCGSEVEQEWWGEKIEQVFEGEPKLDPIVLPCCQARFTLNELEYFGNEGFGLFSLEVMNPGVFEIPEAVISNLSDILQCKLQQVLMHL